MYALNWNAGGRPCLVVGGGHVALRKIRGLLAEGAAVTVLAPEAGADIKALAAAGRIRWLRKAYEPGDGEGFDFLVTACGIPAVARAVQEDAARGHALYNAADFPKLGNCTLPARIRRGSLTIALSTEGRSPAFAKYVKQWLDGLVPEDYGEWLDRLARLRKEAQASIPGADQREAFWRIAFSEDVTALAMQGHFDEAEERIRDAMGRFGTQS